MLDRTPCIPLSINAAVVARRAGGASVNRTCKRPSFVRAAAPKSGRRQRFLGIACCSAREVGRLGMMGWGSQVRAASAALAFCVDSSKRWVSCVASRSTDSCGPVGVTLFCFPPSNRWMSRFQNAISSRVAEGGGGRRENETAFLLPFLGSIGAMDRPGACNVDQRWRDAASIGGVGAGIDGGAGVHFRGAQQPPLASLSPLSPGGANAAPVGRVRPL